jgi:hypothetical protein
MILKPNMVVATVSAHMFDKFRVYQDGLAAWVTWAKLVLNPVRDTSCDANVLLRAASVDFAMRHDPSTLARMLNKSRSLIGATVEPKESKAKAKAKAEKEAKQEEKSAAEEERPIEDGERDSDDDNVDDETDPGKEAAILLHDLGLVRPLFPHMIIIYIDIHICIYVSYFNDSINLIALRAFFFVLVIFLLYVFIFLSFSQTGNEWLVNAPPTLRQPKTTHESLALELRKHVEIVTELIDDPDLLEEARKKNPIRQHKNLRMFFVVFITSFLL